MKRINISSIEYNVLQALSEDKDNAEIAKELFNSIRTIEAVRLRLKAKAKVKTIAGLIIWGIKEGYINL